MAAPAVRAVGAVAAGSGALTPALPSGWQEGDIFILVAESAEGQDYTVPSGWAHVPGSPLDVAGTGNHTLTVLWKRAEAGDTDPAIGDSGDHNIAQIAAVQGCKTSGDPWDVIGSGSETTADNTLSIAEVTTTIVETLVLGIASHGRDTPSANFSSWANANLTGVTEHMNASTDVSNGGGIGMVSGEKATAGATGPTTASLSLSSVKAFFHIALAPDTGGGPPPVDGSRMLLGV